MGRALVTGANRGIGLELCRQLRARGEQVVAACRTSNAELAGLELQVEPGVDMLDPSSIDDLCRRIGETPIDLLVLNAGIMERTAFGSLDYEAIERQFQVNAVSQLRMAEAFVDRMPGGAKLALITSLMGSMTDNGSGGSYGYRMSKAALNAAGVSLSHDLRGRGIAVAILHPGMVATEMTGGRGITVEESARGLLERIEALNLDNSGSFWHADGRELSW